jgi:hypothetical protein
VPNQYRSHIAPILSIGLFILSFFAQGAFSQDESGAQGEVQLSIVSFGVGGLAREGEWAGIQVQLLDLGSAGRDIVLRLAIRDNDGDESQYDRVITANPGALQSFWIYCWIPFRGSNLDYELKAYEAIDSGNQDVGQFGFRVGKLLGQLPIYNPQIQAPTVGLAGIVGNNQLSIDQYGYTTNGRLSMLFGHELLRAAQGLVVDKLPDRWQGLVGFDTLIWSTSNTAETSPGRLSPEKARAIRTWIERGGHLVIALPSSGDPWYIGAHPLSGILPEISNPIRNEGVDLDQFRSLITESAQTVLPDNAVVYSFEPLPDQAEHLAMPILNGPGGECIAIRRHIGSGMVTVIGLPLSHGQLRRVGLPDPESFWHRILGMRGDIIRPDQMTDQQKVDVGTRSNIMFDEGINGAIAKTGRAVQGVLFGIIVFVLYWLLAGPGGFALLKSRNKKQHAWIAFVATIGAFTAIAWIGATSMRPKSANITHLSFLEQVYGQETQRARSWMSAMLPSYGSAVVSLRDPGEGNGFSVQESTNLIAPWTSPDALGALTKGFPDNSGYRVESKNPSALRVPTRATVKTFLTEWSGPAQWSMPILVGDPGAIEEPILTISGTVASGQLVHDLPGALHDVRVFVISREVPILRPGQSIGSRMIAQASVYAPDFGQNGWEPGKSINLEEITRVGPGGRNTIRNGYFTTAVKYGVDQSIGRNTGSLVDRLIASRFISQLEPPHYEAAGNDIVGDRLALRRSVHGWDLGRWFTEPCLIIIGVVDVDQDSANVDGMPTPVWINDRKVPASGKTLVTWIYPFESNPPSFLGVNTPGQGENADSSVDD